MSKPFIISTSILSSDLTNLGQAIKEVESAGTDWIHIDVMDGHFVPNIAMGPGFVKACRRITKLPLDVHLMIEDPERYIQAFGEAGADTLTVHVEATTHLHRTLTTIRDLGMRAGVTLNPSTPASSLSEILSLVDLVLVLTVNPGFYGQTFIENSLSKIHQIRSRLNDIGSEARIEVDGGINAKTAPLAAAQGADVFVAASAIFQHPDGIRAGIETLKASLQSSHTS